MSKKECLHKVELFIGEGNYSQALLYTNGLLEGDNISDLERKLLHYKRGKCLEYSGDFPDALEAFETAEMIVTPDGREYVLSAQIKAAIGASKYEMGEYKFALKKLSEAFEMLRETAENNEVANIQKYLGWCYLYLGKLKRAKNYLEDSIATFRRVGDYLEVAKIKNDLAHVYMLESNWTNAFEHLQEAIEIRRSQRRYKGIELYLTNLGTVLMFLGDFEKSLHSFRKSMRLAKRFGSDYTLTHNNLLIGRLFMQKQIYKRSEEYLKQGLKLAKEKGMKREIAIGHEYLGELAFEQGDYERAELCYEEAKEIAEAIAPQGDLINEIYRRIGDLKVRTGDPEGAWLATERALEVSLNLGDRYEESLTYRVRGLVLKERGERGDALKHLELCLKTLSSVGEKYETARTHLEIGILLGEMKGSDEKLQLAGYHLQNAMDIFDDLGVIFYKVKTAIEMAKVHVAQGEDDMVLSRLKYAGDLVEGTNDEGELAIQAREICRSLEEAIVERVISSNSSYSPLTRSNISTFGFSYNMEGLQGILYHVMDQVKANRGFIARRDGTGEEYRAYVVKGMELSNCEKIINHFKTFDKRIITDKRPFVSVDVTGDPQFDQLWTKVLFNVKSIAIVPFGVDEKSVDGFCYVDRESSLYELPFLFHELEIMSNFSRSLALFVAALERDELRKDNRYLRNLLRRKPGFENIITQDLKMLEALNTVNRVKNSRIFVILMGETGTGKELIARAIHYTGVRRNRKYLAVNCAAFPDNLLESELFGHKKGSFTGAMVDKKGLFEETDHGTFFLDEIADMGLPTQVKLLRVLDNGEIKRVGDTTVRRVDVRIISATNKNLSEEVRTGRFRKDLFYRLDGVMIEIPPLRDRRADIPLLISHFIEKFSAEEKKKIKGITPEALNLLVAYDWPGNVRELMNEIRRAVALLEDGDEIGPYILSGRIKRQVFGGGKGSEDAREGSTLPELMASFEKQRIFMALKDSRWIKTKAAKHLGIHEATLRGKMRRYGLEIPTHAE